MMTLYRIVTIGALALYGAAGLLGWEFSSSTRQPVPKTARSSPGGYRSPHFWHTGFHGGK
ncbi:MAG: hypothetical protein ACOX6T_20670 [Myxococcales bacterium]|jgi:hypothetical protein